MSSPKPCRAVRGFCFGVRGLEPLEREPGGSESEGRCLWPLAGVGVGVGVGVGGVGVEVGWPGAGLRCRLGGVCLGGDRIGVGEEMG